jgi:hypothetical protein
VADDSPWEQLVAAGCPNHLNNTVRLAVASASRNGSLLAVGRGSPTKPRETHSGDAADCLALGPLDPVAITLPWTCLADVLERRTRMPFNSTSSERPKIELQIIGVYASQDV